MNDQILKAKYDELSTKYYEVCAMNEALSDALRAEQIRCNVLSDKLSMLRTETV